ncbi:MAG: hypothetical protein R3E53_16210 [Myxococcota bacterium]
MADGRLVPAYGALLPAAGRLADGLRLPLDSVPWVSDASRLYGHELDPYVERPPLPSEFDFTRGARTGVGAPRMQVPTPPAGVLARGPTRSATAAPTCAAIPSAGPRPTSRRPASCARPSASSRAADSSRSSCRRSSRSRPGSS